MINRKFTRIPFARAVHKLLVLILSPIAKLLYGWLSRTGRSIEFLANNPQTTKLNENAKKAFDDYTPTKNDVFVCAYSKSNLPYDELFRTVA